MHHTREGVGKMDKRNVILTLTTLSHPQETMTGFKTLGLNLTQETLRRLLNPVEDPERQRDSPLGVALLLDIVFALSEGVPELDRPVAGAGDDLPVVGAEADGEDIGGVADEAAGSETGVQVPETEGVVPRRRESELAVGGDNNIRHEVVVAVEDALRVPVRVLVARQLPDDDSLV